MAALKKRTPSRKAVKKNATRRATGKVAARKVAAGKVAARKGAARKVVTKTSAGTGTTQQKTPAPVANKHRVYGISFASVYPLYIQKAEKKGRTKAEVDAIIEWLTGYEGKSLQRVIDSKVDLETFFAEAPRINPNTTLITGVVCGVRVEDVADPLMQQIRFLDKLIDELAQGKTLARILRQ